MCRVGTSGTISTTGIAQINRLVQDRDVAYSAFPLARIAESSVACRSSREILAAER